MRVCEMVFSVGFGPGLDSMAGVGGYNLHSPPDCGTPTKSRLYPFGTCFIIIIMCHIIPTAILATQTRHHSHI